MKFLLTSAVFAAAASVGAAHSHSLECGQKHMDTSAMEPVSEREIARARSIAATVGMHRAALQGRKLSDWTWAGAALNINTIIHDIGGNLDMSQISANMDSLNAVYSPYFEFTLVDVLTYDTSDATIADYWTNGCKSSSDAMLEDLSVSPAEYYNVFSTDCAAYGLFGFSSFPPSVDASEAEDSFKHATIQDPNSWPPSSTGEGGTMCGQDAVTGEGLCDGDTLTHETGHYLGLFHTFQGGCGAYDAGGDLVFDTPGESEPHYGDDCNSGIDSCPDDGLGADMTSNVMAYYDDVCLESVTEGQLDRALWAIVTGRPTLVSAGASDGSTDACLPGATWSDASQACVDCDPFTYKDWVGPEACLACPSEESGSPAEDGGAIDESSCYNCVWNWMGDLWCDPDNNNELCNWDNGDCCETTCAWTEDCWNGGDYATGDEGCCASGTADVGSTGFDCQDPDAPVCVDCWWNSARTTGKAARKLMFGGTDDYPHDDDGSDGGPYPDDDIPSHSNSGSGSFYGSHSGFGSWSSGSGSTGSSRSGSSGSWGSWGGSSGSWGTGSSGSASTGTVDDDDMVAGSDGCCVPAN